MSNRNRVVLGVSAGLTFAIGIGVGVAWATGSDPHRPSPFLAGLMLAMGVALMVPVFVTELDPNNFVPQAFGAIIATYGVGVAASTATGASSGRLLAGAGAFAIGAITFAGARFGGSTGDARLLRTGIAGRARVLEVRTTGVVQNHVLRITRLRIRVRIDDHVEYDATTRIATDLLGTSLSPGDDVAVRVDRRRPSRVMIDPSGRSR